MASSYALRKIIEDLETIQKECDPQGVEKSKNGKDKKLDNFEIAKRDLNFILVELKKSVEKRNEMVQKHGRHEQTIRLKSENEKLLVRAKAKYNDMRKAYEQSLKRKRKRLSDDVLADRKKFVSMFEQEIKDISAMHERARPRRTSQENNIARNLKESREKRRQDAIDRGDSPEPVEMKEMTQQTQAFMLEKEAHDAALDFKLDAIHGGIRDLHEVAVDMNEELNVQNVIIDETGKQIEKLDDKFKTANQRMNRLLQESGGATRWCTLMILFVILLALVAYILDAI